MEKINEAPGAASDAVKEKFYSGGKFDPNDPAQNALLDQLQGILEHYKVNSANVEAEKKEVPTISPGNR